jgi:hypothetical protein
MLGRNVNFVNTHPNFRLWAKLSRNGERFVQHLNQVELARRWKVSPRTLENLRWRGKGPTFIKIGGRVLYRLQDIEAFELQNMRKQSSSRPQTNV